jgi:cation transport protein ChaC
MAPTLVTLTPEQLRNSIAATLSHRLLGDDIWVFGYGSLIWKPGFEAIEQRNALVRGYHRSLCLWSRINRGSPIEPGLVFGLNRGGGCRGVAFRIPAESVDTIFAALWEREMMTGSYLPRWLRCVTAQGDIQALAFVINREASGYAGELQEEELLGVVRRAHGRYGACVDYVMETVRALRNCGIHDRRLEHIVARLEASSSAL